MLPFVLLGGVLVAKKIIRFDLVLSFLFAAFATIIGFGVSHGSTPLTVALQALLHSPLLFFAFIMITEPITTPPTRSWRMLYGVLAGFLFAPAIHVGTVYSTPELALLAGNIFSYLVSPKAKFVLKLKEREKIADGTYSFIFEKDKKMFFRPGQYMEWTLGHKKPDARGNRRYFTLASSPTEHELMLGIKFYADSSSFKKSLLSMKVGDEITVAQLAGDFTLPRNKNEKLAFIAGGIGITPFRSMLQYLSDKNEQRPVVLLYSNKTASEIIYKDAFDSAQKKLGIKTVYTLTDAASIPPRWSGETGRINESMIKEKIPDYRERTFYVSGPHSMVAAFEKVLKNVGVKKGRIKTDFFPGLV
jgi:ferredoxin-NADP reductase